jgi:protein gp37
VSAQTGIEWADSTFNPWIGCTKVSPACDHCYAERDMAKRLKVVQWGAGQPRKRTSAANWKLPTQWNSKPFCQCSRCGWRGEASQADLCPQCNDLTLDLARRRVFCASLADVFDNEVDAEWRDDLMGLIWSTPNLDWLVLTKRIGNVQRLLDELSGRPLEPGERMVLPRNVWLGATICNQDEADRDIPKLLRVPARVRFLSIEPMLGAVNLNRIRDPDFRVTGSGLSGAGYQSRIDWIICGGESGPHARPMHPDWVRSLRDQCAAAGVPFFVKQLSSGGSKPIKDLCEFPPDLRIRQFPEVSA